MTTPILRGPGRNFSPNETTMRLNPHLKPRIDAPNADSSDFDGSNHTNIPPATKRRLKQSQKPLLNKLEAEFLKIWLQYQWKIVIPQSVRFMLGNGIWFKPDFLVIPVGLESQDTRWRAYEVKGPHAFRGGFENLKVAAHKYPFIKWTLAWKEAGVWKEQTVLP